MRDAHGDVPEFHLESGFGKKLTQEKEEIVMDEAPKIVRGGPNSGNRTDAIGVC